MHLQSKITKHRGQWNHNVGYIYLSSCSKSNMHRFNFNFDVIGTETRHFTHPERSRIASDLQAHMPILSYRFGFPLILCFSSKKAAWIGRVTYEQGGSIHFKVPAALSSDETKSLKPNCRIYDIAIDVRWQIMKTTKEITIRPRRRKAANICISSTSFLYSLLIFFPTDPSLISSFHVLLQKNLAE